MGELGQLDGGDFLGQMNLALLGGRSARRMSNVIATFQFRDSSPKALNNISGILASPLSAPPISTVSSGKHR